MSRPAAFACSQPSGRSGISVRPVCLPVSDHSVAPCRRSTIRPGMGRRPARAGIRRNSVRTPRWNDPEAGSVIPDRLIPDPSGYVRPRMRLRVSERTSGAKMKSAVSTSDTLGLMLRDLDQFPMPDHEQQVELAKRVVAGDDAARKQMVAANLRLVVHWARRYQDRGVDMADLVQEGTFGLMRAVDKFDWERGFRFSTYATWWIRQALQRAVQQHGRTIRIPLEVGEHIQRLELTKSELASTLGRKPTVAELDEATGLTADERESLEDVARVTASLDQPAALESSTTLGELVAPDDSDFVMDVEETMVYDRVRDAVERLPGLQRDVLRLRFGFDGDSPASLQSTAERL